MNVFIVPIEKYRNLPNKGTERSSKVGLMREKLMFLPSNGGFGLIIIKETMLILAIYDNI